MISRRAWIGKSVVGLAAGGLASALGATRTIERQAPRILLRPGTGQKGNIGDIAHTPGALQLFEKHFPAAEFTLWPVTISPDARHHLLQQFPRLRIVEGAIGADNRPTTPALQAAWSEADLLLHGSSPGFKGAPYLPAWRAASRKPYGIFGLTSDPLSNVLTRPDGGTLRALRETMRQFPAGHLRGSTLSLLSGAAFVFCRENLTADYFRQQGVSSPVLEFGPDATFGLHLRNDPLATAYLQRNQLEEGRFICVIPRLRYTPYHSINGEAASPADRAKDAVNARTREADHAKLRELIVTWVRTTGLKVLACPEMTYQIALAKEVLVDPLPDDVKKNVVWRDTYWLPDEASSIYARALAVVSFECHSPIMALANGTPAFYVRQPTDTIKGQMYHDIGVSDWTFEVDETEGPALWSRLKTIHADPAKARARVRDVMREVDRIQHRMVDVTRAAMMPP